MSVGPTSLEQLLNSILNSFIDLCRCDAGSVYTLRKNARGEDCLVFESMVTRSMGIQTVPEAIKSLKFNIDEDTVVGRTALHRKILKENYKVNPSQMSTMMNLPSELLQYQTDNLLSGPLITPRGHLVGVVQLLNKIPYKRRSTQNLRFDFDHRDERLFSLVASQAALAVENSFLLQEQENLLEGFVDGFVTAVEARDPVTSGHSKRVCDLTVGLADAINRTGTGPLGSMQFNDAQLREIRFASMLHDIGKVSVREQVLNKEKKLFPWELEVVKSRLGMIRATLRLEDARGVISLDGKRVLKRLERAWDEIMHANEPTILTAETSSALKELRDISVVDEHGHQVSLLTDNELGCLSIAKGSLTEAERKEIELHATYSYEILKKVPWSRGLENVPEYAYCHHERLDGSGYPLHLPGPEVPIQGRMMAICDIYDALTADDRPYKRALPFDRALSIIEAEVKGRKLDGDVFKIFVDSKVYEVTQNWPNIGTEKIRAKKVA